MMKKIAIIAAVIFSLMGVCSAHASLESGVINELNIARTHPRVYAGYVREYRKLYHGDTIVLPGSGARIATAEGTVAVDEAIRFLMKQEPVNPLEPSRGLSEAAADLVEDQSRTGDTGHYGRTSGSMSSRIERHGKWQGEIGEVIGYGYSDPRMIVIQLIVDDGVRGRGHRRNIFNPVFRRAGAACGSHAEYGTMCVIDFAVGFSR
jgi:uncharacterized protein YkwD